MRKRSAVLLLTACVAAGVSGCGSSNGSKPESRERDSITAEVRAPARTEVTAADISRYKDDTASRAFMQFWSALQWQDWIGAIDRYSPGLKRVVGSRNLLGALRSQAVLYRSAKPSIRSESRRRGGLTTVRFSFADQAGARRLSTTTWRREAGRWTLVYDGLLDEALQSWAQIRAQQISNPDAPEPTKDALKAGIEASELQGGYLRFLRPGAAPQTSAPDAD